MIKKLLALPVILAFLMMPMLAHAKGNVSDGEAKAANCSSCHGENGNSMVATFPKLAGQHASYLLRQLKDFKDGERNGPMMASVASALDEQAMEDIAAYYASKPISTNLPPVLFSDDDDEEDSAENLEEQLKELLSLGSNLYRNGNMDSNVSACIACHGPNGEGNKPSSFPSIRSQHSDYIIKALSDFKKGSRSNLPNSMMHLIAKKMTEEEIQAVAFHISMMK